MSGFSIVSDSQIRAGFYLIFDLQNLKMMRWSPIHLFKCYSRVLLGAKAVAIIREAAGGSPTVGSVLSSPS